MEGAHQRGRAPACAVAQGRRARILVLLICTSLLTCAAATAQQPGVAASERTYPKEIRGYKVARAKVEIKKPKDSQSADADVRPASGSDADALVQIGEPQVVSITPLGITFEVPVTVAAVKQDGRVDFLTFEDMVVNGMRVSVEDYMHPFDLPNNRPTPLPVPVRVYLSTPRALLGALGEWSESKEAWPVTGRVYVFGRFKKFLFKFKRVVPIELNLSLPNPLKKLNH